MATVGLSPELHRRISERAKAQSQRLQALLSELLGAELAVAQDRQEAGLPLSERYLTDPRIVGLARSTPTAHVDDTQLQQLDTLLAVCREELGTNVSRAQLLQGLLWQALDPLPPGAERAPLPAPAQTPHITVSIPAPLNTALRELALRRGQRVESLVAELLTDGLEQGESADLAQDDRIAPGDGRGGSTIHIPRALDPALSALARDHFGSIKSRAIQALLWRGPDLASQEASVTDRVLTLDSRLYAAIEQHLRGRRDAGDTRSVPAFVEEAVRALLALEQCEGGEHG
jgi:hypothetical protein